MLRVGSEQGKCCRAFGERRWTNASHAPHGAHGRQLLAPIKTIMNQRRAGCRRPHPQAWALRPSRWSPACSFDRVLKHIALKMKRTNEGTETPGLTTSCLHHFLLLPEELRDSGSDLLCSLRSAEFQWQMDEEMENQCGCLARGRRDYFPNYCRCCCLELPTEPAASATSRRDQGTARSRCCCFNCLLSQFREDKARMKKHGQTGASPPKVREKRGR